jgi:hypothetical protein
MVKARWGALAGARAPGRGGMSHFQQKTTGPQDELRVHCPGKAFRRRGWVVTGRRLVSIEGRRLLATPADTAGLLPLALPELFDTAELAEAAGIERRLAQQMTYCLRTMGVLDAAGKRSGAVVHRRAA